MPLIKISQAILESGKPVEPGYYKAKLLKIERKKSKEGTSVNVICDFELEDGARILPGWPSTCLMNTSIDAMFWPQYLKLITVLCCDIPEWLMSHPDKKLRAGDEVDEEKLLGHKLTLQIENEEYQGQIQTRVIDFFDYTFDTSVPF